MDVVVVVVSFVADRVAVAASTPLLLVLVLNKPHPIKAM